MNYPPVLRLERPSPLDFSSKCQTPLVLTGLMDDWPALGKWSPAFFCDAFPDAKVTPRSTDHEVEFIFEGKGFQRVPLVEYFDRLEAVQLDTPRERRPPYLGNVAIPGQPGRGMFASLRADFEFPRLLSEDVLDDYRLWIGAPGQTSSIHNDNYRNFNAQVFGRKEFLLFPPEAHADLYALQVNAGCWVSPVDPLQPDPGRYPLFQRAQGIHCVLEPGEMLYIPLFWWHYVRAMTLSISVNNWVRVPGEANLWNPPPSSKDLSGIE